MGVFLFIVAILFCIGLHELGHFISAKKFGIKVEQFFIGFGPRLWSIRRGETEYGVKALPLGGFVRIAGMNPFEEVPEEDRGRVFKSRAPWKRAIVLAAGSFTHFVLALFIIAGVLMASGAPEVRPIVAEVSAEVGGEPSPAARAGLRPGDRIVAIDGEGFDSWLEAVALIHDRPGQRVSITIVRDGVTRVVETTLAEQNPDRPEEGRIGFLGVGPTVERISFGPVAALGEAGKQVGVGMKESLLAFRNIFAPSTIGRLFQVASGERERAPEDPTTLVGLGNQAGGLVGSGDFASFFLLIAGFNVFIGVANLLPLPPLDGGHLAVLAYEKITRRDVDMRRLIPVTAAVISVFGSLFLLLLYLDIVHPLPPLG